MRTVTLVEAPTSAGAYAPGQEDGPRALLDAGLVERLEGAGVAVTRGGRVSRFRWRPDPHDPRAANVRNLTSDPLRSARAALSPLAACDGLAVHFDVDLVDFLDAPLAENTDRGIAPSLTACGEALSELLHDTRVTALTVTEFNPHHGAQDGNTTQRLLEVLVNALSDSEASPQR